MLLRAAPQRGAHARQQLRDRKRLGNVVVGAEVETHHLVHLGGARAQQQHRRAVALLAQRVEHFVAVQLGQHDVEDHQIELARLRAR